MDVAREDEVAVALAIANGECHSLALALAAISWLDEPHRIRIHPEQVRRDSAAAGRLWAAALAGGHALLLDSRQNARVIYLERLGRGTSPAFNSFPR